MPISSITKLGKLDFERTDIRAVRAAVVMPNSLKVQNDGAKMTFGIRNKHTDEVMTEVFILDLVKGPTEYLNIPHKRSQTHTFIIFRIAPSDHQRFVSMRRTLLRWRQYDPNGSEGSMSISVDGCRRGTLPEGRLLMTTYIKTAELGEFVPLLKNVDLRKHDKTGTIDGLPLCVG